MRVDVMVKLPPEGDRYVLTVLELTDDGVVVGGRRKEFEGQFKARIVQTKLWDSRTWAPLTAEELDEVRRVRERARPHGEAKEA